MGTLLCPPFNCGLLDYCSPLTLPAGTSSDDTAGAVGPTHRNVFKESLKSLEADVMHANTLLSGEMLRDSEGATLQLRLSFSPLAPLLLFLVQWADCSLAGALGLLRVLIFKVYRNGHSTANIYERKASLRQFSCILYPALQQLYPGISEGEFREQQRVCRERFLGKRKLSVTTCSCGRAVSTAGTAAASTSSSYSTSGSSSSIGGGISGGFGCEASGLAGAVVPPMRWEVGAGSCAEWRGLSMTAADMGLSCCAAARAVERERERECGICMEEHTGKVVLPSCGHALCRKCFQDWSSRAQSCPFCRRGLARVGSGELWELVESSEVPDPARLLRDNVRRFFHLVHSLPVVFADALMDVTLASERRPLM